MDDRLLALPEYLLKDIIEIQGKLNSLQFNTEFVFPMLDEVDVSWYGDEVVGQFRRKKGYDGEYVFFIKTSVLNSITDAELDV